MKIEKYKKLKNGKYQISLEDSSSIELYEDTILKYGLLIKKNIDSNKKEILEFDKKFEVYYMGLKYLKTKSRSKTEVYNYLINNNFDNKLVIEAIKKLEKQGYINDLIYTKSFINNKLITTSSGPYQIKMELQKKGVSNDIIDEALTEYDLETQLEKIRKIINQMIKSNRNKSNKVLKMKITNTLLQKGFSKKNIDEILTETKFPQNDNIAKKEYEKLYKKLSTKYKGEELEYRIKQKMYQKGFDY